MTLPLQLHIAATIPVGNYPLPPLPKRRFRRYPQKRPVDIGTLLIAMPDRVRAVLQAVCDEGNFQLGDILSRDKRAHLCVARQDAYWRLRHMAWGVSRPTFPMIAKWLGRDHTTIIHGCKAHERRVAR